MDYECGEIRMELEILAGVARTEDEPWRDLFPLNSN